MDEIRLTLARMLTRPIGCADYEVDAADLDLLMAQIAALAAERDALQRQLSDALAAESEWTRKAFEQAEGCARLREDAERYRFLRDGGEDSPHAWGEAYDALGSPLVPELIDAAIDKARQQGNAG